jgi:hypothetical protein
MCAMDGMTLWFRLRDGADFLTGGGDQTVRDEARGWR